MIWGEQLIRDKVSSARDREAPSGITHEEARRLVEELDRLRAVLTRIERAPWSMVARLVKEGLDE